MREQSLGEVGEVMLGELLTVGMVIRTSETSLGTDHVQDHPHLSRQAVTEKCWKTTLHIMSASPLIGHAGLTEPRDHSDTVITPLIPGGSIPRHQGGH